VAVGEGGGGHGLGRLGSSDVVPPERGSSSVFSSESASCSLKVVSEYLAAGLLSGSKENQSEYTGVFV
jgi:hypothetical protein